MKYLLILIIVIFILSPSNSLNVKMNLSDDSEQLAREYFTFFREQKIDGLLKKHFLSKTEYLKFNDLLLESKRNKNVSYDYDSMYIWIKNSIIEKNEIAKVHDVNLSKLQFKSVKIHKIDNTLFNESYVEKLLYFEILCLDRNKSYNLTIGPLVKSNGNWKMYLTEFDLRKK